MKQKINRIREDLKNGRIKELMKVGKIKTFGDIYEIYKIDLDDESTVSDSDYAGIYNEFSKISKQKGENI